MKDFRDYQCSYESMGERCTLPAVIFPGTQSSGYCRGHYGLTSRVYTEAEAAAIVRETTAKCRAGARDWREDVVDAKIKELSESGDFMMKEALRLAKGEGTYEDKGSFLAALKASRPPPFPLNR